jgi:PadR family transcriptional regulator, regulatory protein PadR
MELLKGRLDLLLLATVGRTPMHGYAIIADLRDSSGGTFDLPEGSVYPALHRLEREGLIASETCVAEGRRRRTYRLTPAGEAALAVRRTEWTRFVRSFDAVLAGGSVA